MNVTIKEAKDKFCPMGRKAGGSYNQAADGQTLTFCKGNKCMMWKWDNKNQTGEKATGHCGLTNRE